MKKLYVIPFLLLFFSLNAWSQITSPPPIEDEENPIDLAIEKPRPKKVKKETPPSAPAEAKPTEVPSAPPSAETPVAPTQPTTPLPPPAQPTPTPEPPVATTPSPPPITTPPPSLPTPPPPPTATLPPAATPPSVPPPAPSPSAPEMPVPSPVPPPSVTGEILKPMGVEEIAADGGPQSDAGIDLTSALPVTFSKYEGNSLSAEDTIDTFKLYGRAGEGLGIVLIPAHPSMQPSVELLGEAGQLLSQTQAPQPGAPLSFQTSPLDKNMVIYIRIKDASLMSGVPSPELRKYSLELKPIAQAITPPPPPPPAVEAKPEPKAPPAPAEAKANPFLGNAAVFYGLIGLGVLVVSLVILIVIRKTKGKKSEG